MKFTNTSSINAMEISYGCFYKRSSKQVMKGAIVEAIYHKL